MQFWGEGYYQGFHMQDAPVNLGRSSCEDDDPEAPVTITGAVIFRVMKLAEGKD